MSKSYSYKKYKVVFLKKLKKYTTNSSGISLTDDLLNAMYWESNIVDENILNYLVSDFKEEAEIYNVIVSAIRVF